ncbi:MAG: phosphate signaling complex protein PhoU [Gemmataceae bacterium]
MSKHMQRDIEKLQKLVLQMATLVEEAVHRATHALQHGDLGLAAEVMKADRQIDEFENEVQEECLKFLALHQPVAVDLRRISAMLLISTDLERMGDLAVGIAERVRQIGAPPRATIPTRLKAMTDVSSDMVRRSLDAFVHADVGVARGVIRLDDTVDAHNRGIIDELVAEMKHYPDRIDSGLSLFSAVRHLERIADHATNICEDVIYLVDGEIVRHHHESLR